MQPVAPVSIVLRPSQWLQGALVFAHLCALSGVLLAVLPVWLTASLLVLLGASLIRLRSLDAPIGLMLFGDGRFTKVGAGGTALQLDATSTALGPLIILRYRDNGAMRSLVLFQDSFADANDQRRFRRWYLCLAHLEVLSGPA